MLYVSGQAGPRVSFLCRMLQIVIYRSKVIRMKCSLRWSCINHGELHCDSVDSSLLFFVSLLTGARISFLGDSFLNKLNSVWAVLLLPLCDQRKPWFRFSKRTSSVAGLALCLVAFTRATLLKCSLLWRERYSRSSRSFYWALTLSINTRVADGAAIEPDRGGQVGSRKSEVRSQKVKVGSWNRKSNQKSEVRSGKSEV